MRERHLRALRRAGWTDREIVDATLAAALFAYYNRIAEGLGIDLEPEMPPGPRHAAAAAPAPSAEAP